MFAFIKHSGKQFKVAEGTVILVDKLEGDEGAEVKITDIPLVVADDNSITVNPKGSVVCEIAEHILTKKVLVFKQRPKKGYRRNKGHRQNMTRLLVKQINL